MVNSILIIAATCLLLGLYTYFNGDEKKDPVANANPSLSSEEFKKMEQKEQIQANDTKKLSEFKALDAKLQKAVDVIKKENQQEGIIPSQLRIPAINVKTKVEEVGILVNGQMGVPENIDHTGWFKAGVKPGSQGNAVIDGHVDSKTGPAVFFDLKDLRVGDEILLSNKKGKTLTFVVKRYKSYSNDEAPLKKIFGPANGRYLNLITCTGVFNHAKGTHEKRLVVYSELKEKEEIKKENASKEKVPPSPTKVTVEGTFISWHAVHDGDIVGYRVYKGKNKGSFKHVASVSSYERKTFTDKESAKYSYYITSINKVGKESKPSKIAMSHR